MRSRASLAVDCEPQDAGCRKPRLSLAKIGSEVAVRAWPMCATGRRRSRCGGLVYLGASVLDRSGPSVHEQVHATQATTRSYRCRKSVDFIIATNAALPDPNTARLSVISRCACKRNKWLAMCRAALALPKSESTIDFAIQNIGLSSRPP